MVNDTISDMITRIRNAYLARKDSVEVPYSRISQALAQLLERHGYVGEVTVSDSSDKKSARQRIAMVLLYQNGIPTLTGITRVSKPGRRITASANRLPRVLDGYGIAIVSTSQGLMTDGEARKKHVGGEVLLTVY